MSSLRMSKLSVLTKGAAPRVGGAGLSRRVASSTSNVRRNMNVNVGGVAVRAQTERDSQPSGRRTAESPDMYPHPDLIEKTLADFPDAAIANYEQGMVSVSFSFSLLFFSSRGVAWHDVRNVPFSRERRKKEAVVVLLFLLVRSFIVLIELQLT